MKIMNKFVLVMLLLLMFAATAFGDMYIPGGLLVTTILDPTDDHAVPSSYAVSTYLSGGFSQNVLILTDYKLYFRDTGLYVYSSTNGQLDVVADTVLTETSPTITVGASTAYGLTSPAVTITATTSIVHKYDAASYLTQTVTDAGLVTLAVTGDSAGAFEISTDDGAITLDSAAAIALESTTGITATGDISASNAAGPQFVDEAATATNPTLCPNKAEDDTGLGWQSDVIHVVLGGVNEYNFSATALTLASGNNLVVTLGDIDLSNTTTGNCDLILGAALADALTVSDGAYDYIIFDTTATAPTITTQGNIVMQDYRFNDEGTQSYVLIEGYLNAEGTAGDSTHGQETRGLEIGLTRDGSYGTAVLNGNSRDQALKIKITDYVGGHEAGYFIRAIDAETKYDAAGETITAIYGGNITANIVNGTVTSSYVLRLGMKCNGVVTNDFVGLEIQSESQGSISGDSIALQFSTSTINPATGAVTYCMEVAPANTTGFDAFLHFTDGDKTDGSYTTLKAQGHSQESDAGIKVVINATDYYIPLYNNDHVTGEW